MNGNLRQFGEVRSGHPFRGSVPEVAEGAALAIQMRDLSGELVLYPTEDGKAQFFLRAEGGTVWLTQAEIADLFQTTPQNITQHVKAIYNEA